MKSLITFVKKQCSFDNKFVNWKLEQLYKTEILFVIFLTSLHALFFAPELYKLIAKLNPTVIKVCLLTALRFLPSSLFFLNLHLYKRKKINTFTFTCLNNLIMIFVIIFTGLSKCIVPKTLGKNPLGLIMVDSVALIMSSIFSLTILSIFNTVVCIAIVAILGCIVPNSILYVREIILNLIPFGVSLCAVVFSVDNYFKKMYEYILKINTMAIEDNLTGLYNRNILKDKVYDKLTERFLYSGSIIMVDIDHFKNINDTYGHQTGDIALCQLAGILNDNIRKDDYIVRFGGEEFLIILKDSEITEAVSVAERIRTQVENMDFEPKFTVSCGVTKFKHEERFETIAKIADDKLYEAKETGRNKVCY